MGAYGVTTTPGTRFIMNSAATVAFGFPTSLGLKYIQSRHGFRTRVDATYLNKNCLLRLLMSMVSISITWISLNPDKARFARISHPKPPAPITKILHWFLRNVLTFRHRPHRRVSKCRLGRFGGFIALLHRQGTRDRFVDRVCRGFGLHGSIWTPSPPCALSRSRSSWLGGINDRR